MRLFRKIWLIFFVVCSLIVGTTSLLFVTLGYPNDARIDGAIALEKIPPNARYLRIGSILTSGLRYSFDRNDEEISSAKDAVARQVPHFVLSKSRRFSLPGQLHLPVGRYPERIEAKDVLILPSGATLRLEVANENIRSQPMEARFSAVGIVGPFELVVSEKRVSVAAVREVVDPGGLWYRIAGRFLTVDRGDVGPSSYAGWSWTEVRANLNNGILEIRCESSGAHCVISDVGVYGKGTSSHKNFLVVLVDTLRADAVFQGNMPTLAKWAGQNIVFRKAIAPGNMTSPSTNAFLSCQRPSDLGAMAFSYTLSPEDREEFYALNQPSFPEYFRRSGYQTSMIGNVSVVSEAVGVGVNHGFERVLSIEVDGYDTPRVTSEALKWLQKNGDSPFFLYVHFNGPHAPYRAPFSDMIATFPGSSAFSSMGNALRWLYQAEVRYTDRYIQRLLEGIQQLGLEDSTTMVVTADHGDQMTNRRFHFNEAGPAYDGAYYDHGATMLNDEIQVPLFVSGAPAEISDWVQTTDVGPTLLDMAGMGAPAHCAGTSLTHYLSRPEKGARPVTASERVLGSEGFRHRAIIFANRYKYIRGYATNDRKMVMAGTWRRVPSQVFTREELYDLREDPGESANLAASRDDLVNLARSEFRKFYKVGDGFELVVESSGQLPIEISAHPGVILREGGVSVGVAGAYSTAGKDRLILTMEGWDFRPPLVKVGGVSLPLKYTSSRIPVEIAPGDLPIESPGEDGLLPAGNRPEAYIRRIEPNDLQVRRIVTGNPMFDKVLREWGYLNDN